MTADEGFEEKQELEEVKQVVEEHGKEFRALQDEKYFVHEYDSPILHCRNALSPQH